MQHRCNHDVDAPGTVRRPRSIASAPRSHAAFATLLTLLSLPGYAAGQRAGSVADPEATVRVVGRVVDHTTGTGLPLARVVISEPDSSRDQGIVWRGLSGPNGRFEAGALPAGTFELRVETLAFSPLVYAITLEGDASVDLHIEMVPDALELSPLVVTTTRPRRLELGGFYERRATGLGTTMTRADIEALGPPRVTDLFYGLAGVDVIPSTRGRSADVRLRRGCSPQVVLNGAPFTYPISLDDLVNVGELEAIEVYHGATAGALPYYSTNSCGTIMVWTRQLSGVSGKPFEWRRLFAAAGLITVFSIFFP
jgi:hypothetical protein